MADVICCDVHPVCFLGHRLSLLFVLFFCLHSVVRLFQEVNCFHLLFTLHLDQFRFCPHVLHLVLQNVYIDFCSTHVVFKFSLDAFVLLLVELHVFDILFESVDLLKLGFVLVFKHLVGIPICGLEQLDDLKEREEKVHTVRFHC